jgi:tetratricopeptide (TPR) repeat protein
LQLDRNSAGAHGQLGSGKIHLGRADETEGHIREAMRLSPRDTYVYLWCLLAGIAKLHLGANEEAVAWLRRSVEANANYAPPHFSLAAALAHLGRQPEARSEVQVGLAIDPTFSISRFRSGASTNYPSVIAGRERHMDGMRRAGVPEG